MEKEILRAIRKLEELEWITINPHVNRDALAPVFLEIFKDMSLKRAMEIFFSKRIILTNPNHIDK